MEVIKIMNKKESFLPLTRRNIQNICELTAPIGILLNTFFLFVIRDTYSYEKTPIDLNQPTPKSNYITIIQHNPAIGYIYLVCGGVLLISGIYRFCRYLKSRN